MKLKKIVDKLKLKVLSGKDYLDREVKGGYSGDMLSDVLANSKEGDIWLTVQVHPNIVAVSAMKGHSAILITNCKEVDKETIEKAEEEKVVILSTKLDSFSCIKEIVNLMKDEGKS